MAEVNNNGILIRDVETKNIMTKSTLPVGGYSVNPYVGCTHGCKYCYASFMKRFTGHTEPWGTFLDVKHWPAIKNPRKYAGQRVVIGSVTDGYLPQEEQFENTRKLLEQLKDSGAEILICTKSDLVVRDIDLLKEMGKVTVSWSINTLDEDFKNDMDNAVSIQRRLDAMKQVYDAGIRTVCFIAPVFPGITDFEAILKAIRNFKIAAESGNDYAEYMLGKIYLYGREVERDYDKAIAYRTSASEHGNVYAAQLLHSIHANQNWSAAMGAIRLLHHISRIIQNRLEDERRGKGATIDRKLRRKIDEKKQAHGLKQG